MRKKMLHTAFVLLGAVLCLSCSKENSEVAPTKGKSQLEITVTNADQTRVTLSEEAQRVTLKWEDTDKLNICIEQGGKRFVASAKPQSASSATATFKFNLTSEFNPKESYTIYGAINATFEENSSKIAITPNKFVTSLKDLHTVLPLYFKKERQNGSKVTATMQALGSIFTFNIANQTDKPIQLTKFRIEKGTEWLYPNQSIFDIATGTVSETASQKSAEYIGSLNIPNSGSTKLYGYLLPLENQNSSDLKAVINIDGREFVSKAPIKGEVSLHPGVFYNFKVSFDGIVTIETDGITLPIFNKEDLF